MALHERQSLVVVSGRRQGSKRWGRFFRNFSLLTVGLLLLTSLGISQTFVQVASNPTSAGASTVSATYALPETAGNLNVVVVGWSDTSSVVTSVVDDNTNTYKLVGTTAGSGVSQAGDYGDADAGVDD